MSRAKSKLLNWLLAPAPQVRSAIDLEWELVEQGQRNYTRARAAIAMMGELYCCHPANRISRVRENLTDPPAWLRLAAPARSNRS